MARYLTLHLNEGRFQENQVLSAHSMATLHQPAVATPGVDVDYAMGWAVWPFNDAAPAGGDAPIAFSHGGDWLGFINHMLFIPEQELGLVLLMNGHDTVVSSAFSNIAFDVALLAMGMDAQGYAAQEDLLTRNLRPLSAAIVVVLQAATLLSWRRLRHPHFNRSDLYVFVGLGLMDLALAAYLLLIRLPDNETNVRRVLHLQPDLGIMLLVIIVLTLG